MVDASPAPEAAKKHPQTKGAVIGLFPLHVLSETIIFLVGFSGVDASSATIQSNSRHITTSAVKITVAVDISSHLPNTHENRYHLTCIPPDLHGHNFLVAPVPLDSIRISTLKSRQLLSLSRYTTLYPSLRLALGYPESPPVIDSIS